MKALRLSRWAQPARLEQVPVPRPGPGQVLLRILAAGACHSDLHLMEWPEGQLPWTLPFTLGHENAGRVEEVGPGVEDVRAGDAVLVYGPWGCGRCRPCRLGRENYCERAGELVAAGGGLGRDGGLAEFMLVPSSRLLVPLGSLDPVPAAPLSDAALTPYHAIKPSLPALAPGSTAVVIGVGGLGQMAVQLLRALSPARVIAVDKDRGRLEAALGLGASAALASGSATADEIRAATSRLGAELVLDVVGSDDTLALGASVLRAEGRLALIGLAGGRLPFGFFGLPYGAQAATSYWGTIPELIELVALAHAGRIRLEVETFPLDRAAEAYERLRRGEIRGRAVVVPG
ncbi:MAG TPA: NAD(P)-dependent alcohol dehydrogenase [Vicinamibacteria bacterium]